MRTFDSARYTAPQARIRGSSLRRNEEQVFAHESLMIPEAIDRDLARTGPLATCHLALAQSDCSGFQVASGDDPYYRWPETPPPFPCLRRLESGGPFPRGSCFAWRLGFPVPDQVHMAESSRRYRFFDDESVAFLLCVCTRNARTQFPCRLISVMCAAVGHARDSKGRAQHAGSVIPGTIIVRSPCLFCLVSPHKNGLPVPWGRDTPGRCDRAVAYHLIRGNESRVSEVEGRDSGGWTLCIYSQFVLNGRVTVRWAK